MAGTADDPDAREKIIRAFLAAYGIPELYPPQEKSLRPIVEGRNLVVSAPTASGKSLIAYMGVLDTLLRGGRAIYMVPLRALATEKYGEMKDITSVFMNYAEENGISISQPAKVALTIGDYDRKEEHLGKANVIIATSEKVDAIMRHDPPWIYDTDLVIADEIHMISDRHRGPTLEVILARFRKWVPEARIIGLSATINNAIEISSWLDAALVKTDWRPVELHLGAAYRGVVRFQNGKVIELDPPELKSTAPSERRATIYSLVDDSLSNGYQCIVFADTRRNAEGLARDLGKITERHLGTKDLKLLKGVAESVTKGNSDVDTKEYAKKVADSLIRGCAFHHAGLSNTSRTAIEDAFRKGALKCIVATPTLAAGVNLPSRRVIISEHRRFTPGMGKVPLSVMEIQQMLGRAGRPRYDPYGEGILIASSEEGAQKLIERYIEAPTEDIESNLAAEDILRSHILSVISYRTEGMSLDDIMDLLDRTFLSYRADMAYVEDIVLRQIGILIAEDMVSCDGDVFSPTYFGVRTAQMYLDPVTAAKFHLATSVVEEALDRGDISERSALGIILFVLANAQEMQPLNVKRGEEEAYDSSLRDMPYVLHYINWLFSRQTKRWSTLSGKAFGDIEGFDTWLEGILKPPYPPPTIGTDTLAFAKTAHLIEMWIEEVDSDRICDEMGIGPGDLKYHIDNASWMASSFAEVAQIFGKKRTARIAKILADRIEYGVKEEALEVVSIRDVGRVRARTLLRNGFRSLEDIRNASVSALSQLPGIGKTLAIKIIENAGGNPEEEKDGKEEEPRLRGQTTLLNFTTAED